MSAIEPLYRLIGIKISTLTKEENILLEADLFIRICEELKEKFREQHRDYFQLMKFSTEMENNMLENKFVPLIIIDILSTKEYDLPGIACYTNTFQEVVEEVMTGRNMNPSATLLWRLIDLHKSVRRDLYEMIIKKITNKYLAVA